MKPEERFNVWLEKQPRWVQSEVTILRNRINDVQNQLDTFRGVRFSKITYGYGDGRNIPENHGPIRFELDRLDVNTPLTVSVHIEKAHHTARQFCLHVQGDRGITVVPQASNCVRIYLFDE